jgi:hypothetical protein
VIRCGALNEKRKSRPVEESQFFVVLSLGKLRKV